MTAGGCASPPVSLHPAAKRVFRSVCLIGIARLDRAIQEPPAARIAAAQDGNQHREPLATVDMNKAQVEHNAR
jgi:hypothetical protein